MLPCTCLWFVGLPGPGQRQVMGRGSTVDCTSTLKFEIEWFFFWSMDTVMETSRLDIELPHKMSHLDIMEIGDCSAQNIMPESSTRLLRKRKSLASEPSKSTNRRVSMKPRRHYLSETANPKQIQALYLNKKIKTHRQTLETIYEEPKSNSSGSDPYIGNRKVKRLLTCLRGIHYTKEKIKKRRANIKRFFGNKTFLNRKKIPIDVFLKSLECLESDEVVHKSNLTEESDPV